MVLNVKVLVRMRETTDSECGGFKAHVGWLFRLMTGLCGKLS